jgi:hypothetical protein
MKGVHPRDKGGMGSRLVIIMGLLARAWAANADSGRARLVCWRFLLRPAAAGGKFAKVRKD